MRVGVIRGDLPGPLFMSDLEPVSQTDFPVEAPGQSRYVSLPNATSLTNYLGGLNNDGLPNGSGGVPAGIESSAAVTFPVTIVSSGSPNNVLRVKNTSAGSFAAHTITNGTYATMTTLLVAVNAALAGSGVAATTDSTGTLVVLQSTVVGVGSFVAVDTVGNGSTFNTPANLVSAVPATSFTMPAATTIITALLPVGGPLNVSAANILAHLGASPAAAAAANIIAPRFIETDVAIKSFAVGNMSKFLESTYTPDPNRLPALALGAAITVVQDDGTTAFTFAFPHISGAVLSTGILTITGTGLGVTEYYDSTTVIITGPSAVTSYKLSQRIIQHVAGGVVTPTSIVIPAALLPGAVTGSTVAVKFTSLASNVASF